MLDVRNTALGKYTQDRREEKLNLAFIILIPTTRRNASSLGLLLQSLKYIMKTKLNFTLCFFKVATRKFKVICDSSLSTELERDLGSNPGSAIRLAAV